MDKHRVFMKQVADYVSANPDCMPDLLKAASDGMDTWRRRVELYQDNQAYLAISMLSSTPSLDKFKLDKRHHRATARATLVALKLHLRDSSNFSGFEKELCAFVSKADEIDGEDAIFHYNVMLNKN